MSEAEWEQVLHLQHWYNKEFTWTAGTLRFKRSIVFPNSRHATLTEREVVDRIEEIVQRLRESGHSEFEIVRRLEASNLVIVKQGGYFDGCLASGFTRVAGNEYNAYLVCEFLLHVSRIVPDSYIRVEDQGSFIKPRDIVLHNGDVLLRQEGENDRRRLKEFVESRRVFSVVNPEKYEHVPFFRTTIPDYQSLDDQQKNAILRDWNWLGFSDSYDQNGDDVKGLDLNAKVKQFGIYA